MNSRPQALPKHQTWPSLILRFLTALAWLLNPAVAQTASPHSPPSEPPVICPALDQDVPRMIGAPPIATGPIDLIVLGASKPVVTDKRYSTLYELQVDDVLYGSVSTKTIRFTNPWDATKTEPAIFALASSIYEDGYELKYTLDGGELEFHRILSAVRLDFNVLSSCNIFVGHELAAEDDQFHSVRVVRSLHGPTLAPGQQVIVAIHGHTPRSDAKPKVRKEEMIYLINSTASGSDTYGVPEDRRAETVYHLNVRLPADQEQAVVAALARRDLYPIKTLKKYGGAAQVREITFRGTVLQAIDMMGSDNKAIVALAKQLLLAQGSAINDIVAAIERDLTRPTSADPKTFRRLHNLISLLEPLGENHAGGAAARLLDKLTSHIAEGSPELPPKPERHDQYWISEESQTDANHALAWLLRVMQRKDLTAEFCTRLVRLRDNTQGSWKAEVQLALDAAAIEDTLELTAVLAKTGKTKPLSIPPAYRMTGSKVAFSHDGKLLAAGTTIWNVADWSEAASFKNDAPVAAMFFSPDDKFLYVLAGGADSFSEPSDITYIPSSFRLDWRTGQREDILPGLGGGITSATVSSDGSRLVTIGGRDDSLCLWALPQCKLLKSYPLPHYDSHGSLSPDGSLLVWHTAGNELTLESLADGKTKVIRERLGYGPETFIFSPDGRHLIVAADDGTMHLQLYSVPMGLTLEKALSLDMADCTGMAVSPDSSHLVVADRDGCVQVLSLPDLRITSKLLEEKSEITHAGLALSPDGSLLVIGARHDTVRLFNAKSFARIQPATGHAGQAREVHFSADGKLLRTIGSDHTVCRWNAATGAMESRFTLPIGYEISSSRADGRYHVISESDFRISRPQGDTPRIFKSKIIDSDTGKMVCEPAILSQFRSRIHWLDGHRILAATSTHICTVDYLTGKLVKKTEMGQPNSFRWISELTEDGNCFYGIDGGTKYPEISSQILDVRTGKAKEFGSYSLPSFTGNSRGLVPGGKYFYLGTPDLYIFDRTSVKPVAQKKFRDDLFRTAFSSDGSRYAVVTGQRNYLNGIDNGPVPQVESMIRVHDTLSGKTLWAIPAPTQWIFDLRLSPDATRLAALTEDGAITLWNLAD